VAVATLWLVESWTSCLVVRAPAVVVYWAAQGTFFFALFVVGHDCGHGSFSAYPLLNDVVGTVTHGFLMVPYYQWKLSHRNHHKNTANIDKDEVFYPIRRSQQPPNPRLLPGFALGVGWFIYLAVGYVPVPVTLRPTDEIGQGTPNLWEWKYRYSTAELEKVGVEVSGEIMYGNRGL